MYCIASSARIPNPDSRRQSPLAGRGGTRSQSSPTPRSCCRMRFPALPGPADPSALRRLRPTGHPTRYDPVPVCCPSLRRSFGCVAVAVASRPAALLPRRGTEASRSLPPRAGPCCPPLTQSQQKSRAEKTEKKLRETPAQEKRREEKSAPPSTSKQAPANNNTEHRPRRARLKAASCTHRSREE